MDGTAPPKRSDHFPLKGESQKLSRRPEPAEGFSKGVETSKDRRAGEG